MLNFLYNLTPGELVNTVADFFFTSTPTQAEQIVDATLPVVQPVVQYAFNPFGGVQDLICTIPTETAVAVIDNAPAVIDNAPAVIDNVETLIGNASNAVAVIGQTSSPTILEMCSAAASNISDKAFEVSPQTVGGYGAAIIASAAALKVGQVAYDRYRKPTAVTNVASDTKVASDAEVDVDPDVRAYVEAMFKSEAHEAILQMPSDILEAIVEDDTAFSDFIKDANTEQLDALSHLKKLKDFNAFLAFDPEQKSAFLKALSEDNKKQALPRLK